MHIQLTTRFTIVAGTALLLLGSCKPAEPPAQQQEAAAPAKAEPLPEREQALALLTASMTPQVIELDASSAEDLGKLESLGLLTFNNSERDAGGEYFIRVTEQGEAAGLTVQHWELEEQEEAFGPIGVKGGLCQRVADQVAEIVPLTQGPQPAARVRYQQRNEPTALFVLLQPLAGQPFDEVSMLQTSLGWCDAGQRYDGEMIVVQREQGWQANRKPEAVEPGPSLLTEREYDPEGLLVGADTTLTIPGPVTDPDGDPLVVTGWVNYQVFNDTSDAIEATDRVEVEGLTLRFRHGVRMGNPEWFRADYVVADPWEETRFEFCIEDAYVRC